MDFKMPLREQNSNKGTFGKVLNICGSENYIGAAYLSAVSSLKVGAGLSALATTKEVILSVSKLLPEAVYINRKDLKKNINNYDVFLIGCGLGLNKKSFKTFNLFFKNMKDSQCPVVIDADGLNIIAAQQINLPQNVIITPHPLEAARLLNMRLEDVLNDLEKSAIELTKKYNCISVLKTHRTIICNKNLEIYVNNHGNSALAKAGSGDVLSGIIAGLLAQKMPLYEAAKLGVYIHSKAGELASEDLTEYSVLASDLINYLHKAIKELI